MCENPVMAWRWRHLATLLILVLTSTCGLAAQSQSIKDLAAGKILVAPRSDQDPIFGRSVILLVNYDKTGALGLMLNRRTKLPISRALEGMKEAGKVSEPVFVGGPVELSAIFALAREPKKPEGGTKVLGDVYFLAAKADLEKAVGGAADPGKVRIYVGYSGWGPGQLDDEVSEGRWYIFDGSTGLAFDAKPETLWERFMGAPNEQIARVFSILSER